MLGSVASCGYLMPRPRRASRRANGRGVRVSGTGGFMKTYTARPADIQHSWIVVDATGRTLGRLATEIATVLKGKHKPMYTPHIDTGDHVIVVNAEKVRLTGRKPEDKAYFRHTLY